MRSPELRRLVLPDAERAASLRATLSAAPARRDVWVFGYGSLIWNPAFHFVEKRTARIHGYHRRFCLWTQLGRGSAGNPGLMLGLERGGACRGVMFRIVEEAVETELDILWRREMFTGAYCPTWVSARSHGESFPAITFVINRENSRYAGRLPDDEIARHIATAVGPMGACCDYLFQTVEHLAALGLRDRRRIPRPAGRPRAIVQCMVRARLLIAWLAVAAMVTGGATVLSSEDAAEVVPRADDLSLKLSIENIDGKVVNVPEASIRKIPPGDHYLGIKIEFRNVSGGSLFSELGTFSAFAGAVSEKPPSHDGVSFTALPGRRYLVNGAMVDGKPKVWIEEELFEADQDDDRT